MALLSVAGAIVLSLLLKPLISDAFLFLFISAVITSAWCGGMGPGVLAVLFSSLAVEYLFVPPYFGFHMNLEEIPYLLSFLLTALLASWLSAARKDAEESHRAHFDELFEQSPEAIMLLDPHGRVLRINKRFSRLFGLESAEIVGKPGMELIVPFDLRHEIVRFKDRLTGGQALDRETVRTRKDGARIDVSEMAVPIFVAGKPVADYVIYKDISEVKRAAAALHKAQAELTHLSRVTTMGELVASIAHEVNQPITGMKANGRAGMHWLDMAPPDLEEAREAFALIVRDAERAGSVLYRIRSLLRKDSFEVSQVDINDVIQSVLHLTQTEIRKANILLQQGLTAKCRIAGDRIQLQQVVLNLIMNAIDAMSDVTGRQRELCVGTWDRDQEVLVVIRDSGIGFDSHSVDCLFEPFFTTKPQGIGMGLSISRSIIERHGGLLWATAETHGATFQFTLPTEETHP